MDDKKAEVGSETLSLVQRTFAFPMPQAVVEGIWLSALLVPAVVTISISHPDVPELINLQTSMAKQSLIKSSSFLRSSSGIIYN